MERRRVPMRKAPSSSPVAFIAFYWSLSVVQRGMRRLLNFRDLWAPSAKDYARDLGFKLDNVWGAMNHEEQRKGRLWKALWKIFALEIVNCVTLTICVNIVMRLLIPFFVLKISEYVETTNGKGSFLYFSGLVFISIGAIFLNNQLSYRCFVTGMKFQQAINGLIYRKALRLSAALVKKEEVEIIKNTILHDPGRLDVMSLLMHYIWAAPIMFLISGFILFHYIKLAALPGIFFILVMGLCPIFCDIWDVCFKNTKKLLQETKERVLKTIEFIIHIEVLKKQAWISYFVDTIREFRKKEQKCLHYNLLKHVIHTTLLIFTSRIALCATLITISFVDREQIFHRDIFLCFYYFDVMAIVVPQLGVRASQQLVVTMDYFRDVEEFMDLEEQKKQPPKKKKTRNVVKNSDKNKPKEKELLIELKQVFSAWPKRTHVLQENKEEDKQHPNSPEKMNSEHELKKESENLREEIQGKEDFEEFDGEEQKCVEWKNSLTFKNLNIKFMTGLTCIVGPQKCGKTSLLYTLLQEMCTLGGMIDSKGAFGYAPQEPWNFSASIQNNILFGSVWDEKRYRRTLEDTTLMPILKSLPDGDATFLQDDPNDNSNISLRTLINIARAIYKETNVYIFDDNLSHLEPARSEYIFQNVLKSHEEGQLDEAARILVTNKLKWIKQSDHVLVMSENGVIIQEGPPDMVDLESLGYLQRKDDTVGYPEMNEINRNYQEISNGTILQSVRHHFSHNKDDTEDLEAREVYIDEAPMSTNLKLIVRFLRQSSGWLELFFLLVGFILCYCMSSLTDISFLFWVTMNSAQANKAATCLSYINCSTDMIKLSYQNITHNAFFYEVFNVSKDFIETQAEAKYWKETTPCVLVYAALLVAAIVGTFLINYILSRICLKSSTQIHNTLLDKISNASFEFFQKAKTDDITRLFEYDMVIVDNIVPKSVMESINLCLWILSWGCSTFYINPIFAIFLIVCSTLMIIVQHKMSETAVRLKQLEVTIRMRMKQYFDKTINSVPIIRAFKVELSVHDDYAHMQDLVHAANFGNIAALTGLSQSLEIICLIIMLIFYFLALYEEVDLHDTYLMFAFFQLFNYTGMLGWSLKQTTSTLRDLSAMKRIFKAYNAQPEPFETNTKMRIIRNSWPENAEIKYENVSVKYQNSKIGVMDVNIKLNPREHVGVIGESRSGKTSLINALYRIGNIDGHVSIDTYPNNEIPLDILRSKITTITRKPAVFSGTILSNLDPFGEYLREDLLSALKIVSLGTLNLDMVVEHNGSNLTDQQRHLLIFARSLLPDKRIVVIDDAISAMDLNTQNLVLNIIKDHMRDRTTFIISRELHHVIYCQSVAILENNKIVEFGLPYELLTKKDNKFYDLTSSYKKVKPATLKIMAYDIIKKYPYMFPKK